MSVRVIPWKPGRLKNRWLVDIRFRKLDGTKIRDRQIHPAPTKAQARNWGEAREAQLRAGILGLNRDATDIPTHSKGALVALVNWLLVEKAKLNAGHQESERQFQAKCDEIGALLGKVDELTAQRDAFGQKAYELQEEVLRVRALIHLDRTGLAEAIERMVKEAAGRLWVTDGRGPYAWDDERYKDEAGQALRSVIEIGKKALGASGDNADSAFRPEAPRVVMWGGRKMKEGRCPPGNMCLACDRLGKHLEPAG